MLFFRRRFSYRRFQVELFKGAAVYFSAFRFIGQYGWWSRILMIGALVYLLFDAAWNFSKDALLGWLTGLAQSYVSWVVKNFGLSANLLQYLPDVMDTLLEQLKFPLLTAIFLVLGSPLFVYFSRETERLELGKLQTQIDDQGVIWEIWRGVKISCVNLLKQGIVVLPFLLFGLLPVVGFLSSFFIFLVQAYFNGFTFLDYSLERRQMNVRQSSQFCEKHKGYLVGLGLGLMFMSSIPSIGWFIAPMVATIASCLLFVRRTSVLK